MLDIHPASAEEKLETYRNVHEFWGGGLPLDDFLRRRQASVQHNRARWYVGCLDGRVVTSLGCYPLRFWQHGEIVKGIAIGSVHTVPDCRRRGLAARLMNHVERAEADDGARVSLLYSDIDPAYYAAMGYQPCPSWQGHAEPDAGLPTAGWRLRPFDATQELTLVMVWYDRCHAPLPLAVARDQAYWQYTIQKSPHDSYYWLTDPDGEKRGYIRISQQSDLRILDYGVPPGEEETLSQLFQELQRMGAEQRLRAGGWLPDLPVTRQRYRLAPRTREITMIKLLDGSRPEPADLVGTDHFTEIDHV